MKETKIEDITVKQIKEICDRNECFDCPLKFFCVIFDVQPFEWEPAFMKGKVEV